MKKFACNCLKESEEKFDKYLSEKEPKYESGSAKYSNISGLMLDGSDNIPYMTLSYKKQGIKKDYETNIFMNYCPFCGTKYKNIK